MAKVWGDVLSVLRGARGEEILVRHAAVRGVREWRCRENWRGADVARPRLLIDASLKTILAVVRALEPVAACELSPEDMYGRCSCHKIVYGDGGEFKSPSALPAYVS